MRRILLVLGVSLVMAAMLIASALPALAQDPPTIPPGAVLADLLADPHNPALDVNLAKPCVTLDAPSFNNQVGHHSDYPDDCSL